MNSPLTLQRLKSRLYGLAFADELGPLYAVYTLWFNDNGISTSQISTVFVLWAAVAIVLEVPSGALADRVDRRHLLAFAFGLRAVGIGVWLLTPTYAGMIIGALLWAVHSALASGAWEAQIHDQLTAIDNEDRYAPVMARVGQFSNLGVAVGTVLAFGALRYGGSIEFLGWVTVALHAVSIAIVVALPNVRWVARGSVSNTRTVDVHGDVDGDADPDVDVDGDVDADEDPSTYGEWFATLRNGVAEATAAGPVLQIVIIGAFLEGLFILDEYVPLLARDRGVSDSVVPLFVLVVWVGLLAGGELVARRPNLSGRSLGLLLVLGSVGVILGLRSDSAAPLLLVGVGYAALEAIWISSDARLQQRVGSTNRATVTSVRGLGSGIIAAVAFAMIGALSDGDDPRPGLMVALVVLIIVGAAATRWLPDSVAGESRPSER